MNLQSLLGIEQNLMPLSGSGFFLALSRSRLPRFIRDLLPGWAHQNPPRDKGREGYKTPNHDGILPIF
jgi:hypothetical protein